MLLQSSADQVTLRRLHQVCNATPRNIGRLFSILNPIYEISFQASKSTKVCGSSMSNTRTRTAASVFSESMRVSHSYRKYNKHRGGTTNNIQLFSLSLSLIYSFSPFKGAAGAGKVFPDMMDTPPCVLACWYRVVEKEEKEKFSWKTNKLFTVSTVNHAGTEKLFLGRQIIHLLSVNIRKLW